MSAKEAVGGEDPESGEAKAQRKRGRDCLLAPSLMSAIAERDEELALSLLDLGANPRQIWPMEKGGFEAAETADRAEASLCDVAGHAAIRGMPNLLERALGSGAGRAEGGKERKDGRIILKLGALHALALSKEAKSERELKGRLACLEALSKAGFSWEEGIAGDDGATPLRLATRGGLRAEALAMLDLGCPMDAGIRGERGQRFWPWESAAGMGHSALARDLLERASDRDLGSAAAELAGKASRWIAQARAAEDFGRRLESFGRIAGETEREQRSRGMEPGGAGAREACERLSAGRAKGGAIRWDEGREQSLRSALEWLGRGDPEGALVLGIWIGAQEGELERLARACPASEAGLRAARLMAFPGRRPEGWMALEEAARLREAAGPAEGAARGPRGI